ncbi:hypothetical protein [Pseudomonas sp. NBRC 111119]|uniref:hypothetical protein n=1 Tax=Pseudomonas sp. NBRC 111119 TaxID=1661034 RepID=UPI000760D086|nr:hypothetical protein [Pseudomonas sp. NBRC 111119]
MSAIKRERQYQAYQALKQLTDAAGETMKQIAYDQFDHIDWQETCRLHREVFERWIIYAQAQGQLLSSPNSDTLSAMPQAVGDCLPRRRGC